MITEDGFLGGRLRIRQPGAGYRAATDPVFLAAAVPATAGQRVLEMGCGVGVAALCLAARTGAAVTGVEVQPAYAELARGNAALNGLPLTVIEGDIAALRLTDDFDHVMANPPYYTGGTPARDPGRDKALREDLPLGRWIAIMARRLRPGGTMTLIFGAARLPDALRDWPAALGSITVLPLAARAGRAPKRLILQARKGGRGDFVMTAPAILHEGPHHAGDHDDATALARSILREGGGFPQPLSAGPCPPFATP
ncbi:tRNA1(Val) (adenine(37)-N6)-methyltransferase [Falsirhodobacter algicola]|uniref:Methyltransferase n=1 Tax=Falsirhodobacter algicola TaxID=2692330 RepID=A0A8J8SKW6_9RHOB|nr:methyltransferase domain-containing protein [Falsirhodobacter algicola]QUS35892.1 methyltransferase [Falsirhodobacter algicola]